MSNDPPPYPPPPRGGQPPGSYPSGGNPAGGYPQGGYPAGQPAYGAPYGPPGQAGFGTPPGGPRSKRWYQRWWVWLIIVVVALMALAIIIAIVNGNKYALESKIKQALQNSSHTVSDVQCPNSINTGAGHSYECTAVVDGSRTTLHVAFVTDQHFVVS